MNTANPDVVLLQAPLVALGQDPAPSRETSTQVTHAESPHNPNEPSEKKPKRTKLTESERAARDAAKAAEKLARDAEKAAAREARKRAKAAEAEANRVYQAEQRELHKRETAERRAREKAQARLDKIAAAEGGKLDLPAVVLRDGTVFGVKNDDVPALLSPYLPDMMLDVEHSGYDFGHEHYELRTIQLGGYGLAVVLDAADPEQLEVASWALNAAEKLRAFSAHADAIPCVMAELVEWDVIWDKMYDVVLNVKLTDPQMSESDSGGLKDLERDMFGDEAVAWPAERAKNELFRVMGCLTEPEVTTPPERNGWYMVDKRARTMIRYAGSDILALAAVAARLDPVLPVTQEVLDSERAFEKDCAEVGWTGFKLDAAHVKAMIAEHEQLQAQTRLMVELMSGGKITNPSSPTVGSALIELHPRLDGILEISEKTGKPSAAKASLEKIKKTDPEYPLAKTILEYRGHVTVLGLLLRPLEALCDHGDGRMRPTVLTIEADTGRCSCRNPNGMQFSRKGRVRKCVVADDGYAMVNADFTGCEIRVGAGLSGDRMLLDAETKSFCYLHDRMATPDDLCDCGWDAEESKPAGHIGLHWMAAHTAFGKEATKTHRYWCKRIIFSKMFGGSAAAGARQVGIDVDVSQRIHDAFEELAPEYAAWDKWLRSCYFEGAAVWRDFSEGVNYSTPLDGRRRGIYRTYSGRNIYVNAPHAFSNYAIQGTARELLKDGVLAWKKQVRLHPEWEASAVLPIHDEVLTWVREEYYFEAAKILQSCMATDVLSVPGWDVLIGADPELELHRFWPDSGLQVTRQSLAASAEVLAGSPRLLVASWLSPAAPRTRGGISPLSRALPGTPVPGLHCRQLHAQPRLVVIPGGIATGALSARLRGSQQSEVPAQRRPAALRKPPGSARGASSVPALRQRPSFLRLPQARA